MTETMKTVCVGRYLVDVPYRADVSLSHERIHGFAVDTVEETEAEFRQRISEREAVITAAGANARGDEEGGMVEARDLRVAGMVGRTLIFGRRRAYLMEGARRVYLESVLVETHAHLGALSFSLSASSAQEDSAREAEALMAQLRLRGEDEIPGVPGFCVQRAVFAEPLPAHKTEHIVMHMGLASHPDLALRLVSMPGGGSDPSLTARNAAADAHTSNAMLLRTTKLRERKRIVNGIAGEEVLIRAREFNLATTYGFGWETPGADDDPLKPYLSLELRTGVSERPGGKPVSTSLHEDALLALWDSITSSIRVRSAAALPPPGSPADPSARGVQQLATY